MKNTSLIGILFVLALGLTSCGSDSATESAAEMAPDQTALTGGSAENPALPTTPDASEPVQPQAPTGPTTTMSFKYLEYDFGSVKDGEVVRHDYEFTNTGTEPLIIADAKASCGCTVPQWPKEPIQPGAKGKIRVEFDSKGKPGPQSKRVTITANTDPSPVFLTIKGNVEGKPTEAAKK